MSGGANDPAMGLNLNALNTYGSGFQTLDLFKQADGWRILDFNSGFNETEEVDPGYFDPFGWPTRMPDGADAGRIWFTRLSFSDDLPTGSYILTWQGDAEIGVEGNVTSRAPNRIEFDVTPRSDGSGQPNGLQVYLDQIGPSGFDNLRVFRAEDEARVLAGEIWRPTYLDQVGQFRVVRPMDMLGTNSSDVVDWDPAAEGLQRAIWADRAPMAAALDLANTVNADLWITIPHLASDDYVRDLARFLRDGLDPELRVIVEYSNEHWTRGFEQREWFEARGRALFGEDAAYPGAQFYGLRAGEVLTLFNDAFGSPERVETVMTTTAGFGFDSDYIAALFDAPGVVALGGTAPAENPIFDALAVDTYFDGGLIFDENAAVARNWFETLPEDEARDRVFDAMTTGAGLPSPYDWNELAANYRLFASISQQNDWDFLSYEGGSFLITQPWDDPAYTDFIMSLNRDPRIVEFNARIYDTFIEAGGGLIATFADTGYDGYFGNWSSYDTGFDTAPNFRGSVAVAFNEREPWYDTDGRDPAVFIDDSHREEDDPDVISGTTGDDTLRGTANDDRIEAGAGDDVLRGRAGADDLIGGDGNDVLRGGAGRDRLEGGGGRDRLIGGDGADVFVFAPGDGRDRIVDFTLGEDRIDLRAFALPSLESLLDMQRKGDDTVVLLDDGETRIRIADLQPEQLQAEGIFIF
ncbi:MAG: hypothetical protein AAF919_00885 [Pseudomonadota bacterium]